MAVDLNDPEVKAALEEAVNEAVKGLKAKNAELLRKVATASEIKPEDHQRALEERDALAAKLEVTSGELKAVKASVKALETAVKSKDVVIEKTMIDDALTNALVKANVRPELLNVVKSHLRSNAKVVEENGEYRALMGDKAISEAITAWSASDEGKAVIAAPANGGGGAGGSKGDSGAATQKMSQPEFEKLTPAAQKSLMQAGKVEIVQAAA
jgi:hypothetical protein